MERPARSDEAMGGGAAPPERIGSDLMGDYGAFRVRRDLVRVPETGAVGEHYLLELDDWVEVVPVAADGRLLLLERWGEGARRPGLEFPAATVERGEDACAAARRELWRAVCHRAAACELLGELDANPALQSNRVGVVLATGCTRPAERERDGGDDAGVVRVSPERVPELIAAGRIRHAIAVSAWYLFLQHTARPVE